MSDTCRAGELKCTYDGIDEAGASVGRRAHAETCVLDVAPVTPLVTDALDTRAPLVNNELRGESGAIEERRDCLRM